MTDYYSEAWQESMTAKMLSQYCWYSPIVGHYSIKTITKPTKALALDVPSSCQSYPFPPPECGGAQWAWLKQLAAVVAVECGRRKKVGQALKGKGLKK